MRCVICLHPRAAEINRALMAGTAERAIAVDFELKKSTVHTHKIRCLQTIHPAEAPAIAPGAPLQAQLDFLVARSLEAVERCSLRRKDALLLKAIELAVEVIEKRQNLIGATKEPVPAPRDSSYSIAFRQGRPVAVQAAEKAHDE